MEGDAFAEGKRGVHVSAMEVVARAWLKVYASFYVLLCGGGARSMEIHSLLKQTSIKGRGDGWLRALEGHRGSDRHRFTLKGAGEGGGISDGAWADGGGGVFVDLFFVLHGCGLW